MNKFLISVAAACVLTSVNLDAQTKLGEITIGTNTSDRCVGAEFNNGYLYCSRFVDGVQVVVDMSNPILPSVVSTFNPQFGDQWHDPLFFKNKLYTGHRFGGLNCMDASGSGTLSQGPAINTLYFWKGLVGKTCNGTDYLFYSEAAAFGQGGGLEIYDPNSLSLIGQVSYTDAAGSDIAITSDCNWAFQLDNGDRINTKEEVGLDVYDVSNKSAPTRVTKFSIGTNVANRGNSFDIMLSRSESHLFMCTGYDGLRIVDVSNPASPILCGIASKTGVRIEGITPYQGDIVIVTAFLSTASKHVLAFLDMKNPCRPKLLSRFIPDMDRIYDVEVDPAAPNRFYVVGTKNSLPHVQVWQ